MAVLDLDFFYHTNADAFFILHQSDSGGCLKNPCIVVNLSQVATYVSLRAPIFFRGVASSILFVMRLPRRAPALLAATIIRFIQGGNLEYFKNDSFDHDKKQPVNVRYDKR
jgi:hypothetical protein